MTLGGNGGSAMSAMRDIASVRVVADDSRDKEAVGKQLKDRRLALGLDYGEVARRAGVDRSRVPLVEAGDPKARDTTYAAIDRALSELEHEMSMDLPSQVEAPEAAPMVRFIVEGVYGAKALIVEAPPGNLAELEAAVDRIMRNLRGDQESGGSHSNG